MGGIYGAVIEKTGWTWNEVRSLSLPRLWRLFTAWAPKKEDKKPSDAEAVQAFMERFQAMAGR